jgi:hypothetical protein
MWQEANELLIHNGGEYENQIVIEGVTQEGRAVVEVTRIIPPHGSLFESLRALFGEAFEETAYLKVRSSQPASLVGHLLFSSRNSSSSVLAGQTGRPY